MVRRPSRQALSRQRRKPVAAQPQWLGRPMVAALAATARRLRSAMSRPTAPRWLPRLDLAQPCQARRLAPGLKGSALTACNRLPRCIPGTRRSSFAALAGPGLHLECSSDVYVRAICPLRFVSTALEESTASARRVRLQSAGVFEVMRFRDDGALSPTARSPVLPARLVTQS